MPSEPNNEENELFKPRDGQNNPNNTITSEAVKKTATAAGAGASAAAPEAENLDDTETP